MDLQQRLTRLVPTEMLNDPDFTDMLKEKARNTEPSEESGSESKPIRLVSPHDRDLVPRLEQRVQSPAFGPLKNDKDAAHWTHHVVSVGKSWVGVVIVVVLLFFSYVLYRQQRVAKELGVSCAVFAEFPVLSPVCSAVSGQSAAEMRAQIAALDAPPGPTPEELAAHKKQQEAAHRAYVEGLVKDSLAEAHPPEPEPAQEPKKEKGGRAKKVVGGKKISL